MKKIRYLTEAIILYLAFALFRIMPVDSASACGGWLGRTLGPRLAASRKAMANLRAAFPDRDEKFYIRTIAGMWDNLGRVMAEFPHTDEIGRTRVEIVNKEFLPPAGQPVIIFGAHLGNWETILSAPRKQLGMPLAAAYREPNNPWTGRLLSHTRSPEGDVKTIAKSKASVREFVACLQEGRALIMLIDQKYNEGIPVPFFGRDAMTSTAFVKVPQKSGLPLIPARTERLDGAHFRITFHRPFPVLDDEGQPRPVPDVVKDAHTLLEKWISERPQDWLWLHRRWPGSSRDQTDSPESSL